MFKKLGATPFFLRGGDVGKVDVGFKEYPIEHVKYDIYREKERIILSSFPTFRKKRGHFPYSLKPNIHLPTSPFFITTLSIYLFNNNNKYIYHI